ncbi:MAG: flagellar hook-length control protein FliK [Eubacteriales bacterium]
MRISFGKSNQTASSLGKISGKINGVRNLQLGDVFLGEIMDIRKNLILIRLNNNQQVLAKVLEQLELTIGQEFMFQVKDKNDEQLVIKPLSEKELTPQEQKLVQALEEANLPITKKNLNVVRTLIEEQLPINKSNLQQYIKLSNKYKEYPFKDIILFKKNNWTINKDFLNQFNTYKEGKHQLSKVFQRITEELVNHQYDMINKNQDKEAIIVHKDFQKLLIQINDKVDINNEIKDNRNDLKYIDNKNHQLHEVKIKDILNVTKRQILYDQLNSNDLVLDKDFILNDKMTPNNFFETINSLPIEQQEKIIKILIKNDIYKPLLKQQINDFVSIRPENINKESIKEFFTNIDKLTSKTIEILNRLSSDAKNTITTSIADAKNNIDFMKLINQAFQYVQLPVKLKDQVIHSDLYVYKNSKNQKNKSNNTSVFLRLDLAYLGEVGIYLNKQFKTIQSNFYIDNRDTRKLIGNNLYKLVDKMKSKGYTFIPNIVTTKKDFDFVDDFIKCKEDNTTDIKRFSFDIRV